MKTCFACLFVDRFVVGTFVTWFWLSIICAFCPILMLFAMAFIPETPRYLLMKNRDNDAKAAFEWLCDVTDKKLVEPEFLKVIELKQ